MQNMDVLFWVSILVPHLPTLIVLLVGFIIAMVRWKKHPAVSIIMVVIVALEVLIILPLNLAAVAGPVTFMRNRMPLSSMGMVLSVLSIISTLVTTVVWGLVLAGFFGWRQASEKANPLREEQPPEAPTTL